MNLNFFSIVNVMVMLNVSVENVDRNISDICMISFYHLQKVQTH